MFCNLHSAYDRQSLYACPETTCNNIPEEPFPMVLPILQFPTLAFSPPRVLLDVVSLRVTDAPWCDGPSPLDPDPDA